MPSEFTKIITSVRYALRGIFHALLLDQSFRLEVIWGFPLYLLVGYLLWPLSEAELFVFIFSYVLILIVELINTSIEHMLERVHPEWHETIGRSKDIASAAVLVAFLFAIFVVITMTLVRVW